MENCLNCGTELTGKYCANCGQEKITGRMSLKSLFHEFLHSSFHWESTLLHTIKGLFTSPGDFIHSFINGKRKHSTKPVSFFILMLTVFVILFHLFSDNFITFVNDVFMGEKADKFHPMGVKILDVQHFFFHKINYFYFLLPPLIAGYFLMSFRKLKINFAEALTFSLYTVGMGLFISLFLVLFALINVKFWSFRIATTFAYYIFAMMSFSGEANFSGFFKSLAATILSYFTYAIIVVFLAFTYILLFH